MARFTKAEETWLGQFGREYTDRDSTNDQELEAGYKSRWGLNRTELNEQFLSRIDRSIRILEVGTNLGNQLLCLQNMGFNNLYGIEIQTYAVEMAKYRTKDINIIHGSALDIPFKDGFFDLVFTSGVLIHIQTDDVTQAMREIYRCSNKYIWGLEFYADELTKIDDYRGQVDLLWKENFSQRYLDLFPDLTREKEEFSHYPDSDNMDTMFLLSKGR